MKAKARSRLGTGLAQAAVALCAAFLSASALAAACTAAASTAWNVQTTWGAAGVGCVGAPGGIPGASDTVSIGVTGTPRAVTVPGGYAAQALGITIGGTGTNGASRLTLSAPNASVTVGMNGLTLSGPANNNTNGLFVDAGSATVNGDIVFNDTSGTGRIANVTITTGSLDVNGSITMNATTSSARNSIVMSGGAGNLFVSGSFTLANSLGTLTPGTTSTVTFDTGGAATVATGGAVSYRHLKINKSGGTASTSAAGNLTVLGDLTVQAGTFNVVTSGTTTVTGNLDVQAGLFDIATTANTTITGNTTASGEVRISAGTGTRTFTGNVTISSGTGKWNNTANAAVTLGGNLTNDNTTAGSFVSGSGLHTLTNARVFAGAGGLVFDGNVALNGGRTNNTTVEIKGNLTGGSTLTNSASRTLKLGGTVSAGLAATAADNIINFNGTAAQVIPATFYYHLTVDNATGPVTLNGFTTITGNLVNNGGFDGVTGNETVTLTGAATQNISGAAAQTRLYNLTVNNTGGVSLSGSQSVEVTNTLTLNDDIFVTGSNTLFVSRNAAAAILRSTGFVDGNLKWSLPTGAGVLRTFPVGTGSTYSPAALTFASITTAGNITVSSTAGSHPDLPNSGLDTATPQKLNRYWTVANQGVAFTSYDATFTFVAGDVDSGASPTDFIVARYTSGSWGATTLGTAAATTISITGETNFGDFAAGEVTGVSSSTGRFNAYDPPPLTTAGAVTGFIRTKLVGTSFSLTVIHLNAAGTAQATFGKGNIQIPVTVDLIDGTTQTGAFVSGCYASWISASPIATGNVSFTGNSTTSQPISFTVSNAYRDVRVRISGDGEVGCSGDRFSIRPTGFTISSNATNSGSAGGLTFKTGASFTLTAATGAPGYNGAPLIDTGKVVGTPIAGVLGGSFNAVVPITGTVSGDSFYYGEVGNFGLEANAIYDSTFTSVDQPLDCTADFSNALVGGKYGCSFGSAAVPQTTGSSGFGRFIPDNFDVAYNMPSFTTACGTASYVGQVFTFATPPALTVTARKGTANGLANATAQNYAGAYVKLSNATLTPSSQAARYSRFDALGGAATPALDLSLLPATSSDPAIGTFTLGVGTLAFGAGGGIAFTRPTAAPSAPFDADIALGLNIIDEDGVAFAGNPASFGTATSGGGMAFSAGKQFRFGQLQLQNAHGSQALDLTIPVEIQYWTGTIYQRNILDSCTTLATNNFTLGNRTGGLTGGGSGNMENSKLTAMSAISAGLGSLTLAKPDGGAQGSVEIALNLGSGATANACPAWAPTATAANRTYLRGNWCGGAYDKDPVAKATFGIYRNRYIFRRENY